METEEMAEDAFTAWWDALLPEERYGVDRRSCWLGYVVGAQWGTDFIAAKVQRIFEPEETK